MPPELNTDPEPQVQDPEPTTPPVNDPSTTISMDRYRGLQRTHQKQVDKNAELESTIDKLTSDNEELRQQMKTFERNLTKAQDELGTSSQSMEDLQKQLGLKESELERKNLILKEFPELADFEANGLLPDKSGEELTTALEAFRVALEKRAEDAGKLLIQGATPPEPDGDEPNEETPDELRDKAMKAAGDPAKFNEAMNKYMESLDKEK